MTPKHPNFEEGLLAQQDCGEIKGEGFNFRLIGKACILAYSAFCFIQARKRPFCRYMRNLKDAFRLPRSPLVPIVPQTSASRPRQTARREFLNLLLRADR
jgi:hypothetical protein